MRVLITTAGSVEVGLASRLVICGVIDQLVGVPNRPAGKRAGAVPAEDDDDIGRSRDGS
jgi:hypothetical protein